MPCRINKGRKWSSRILMEWMGNGFSGYFVTLTYAPEHLPEGGNLDKPYILQWVKNVQKRKTGTFRYYLVGEYGDDSGRPHYHMAIFPEHPAQVRYLTTCWEKGFIQVAEINHARARYLANYTGKKLTKTGPQGRVPEFRTSSRNPPLGADFVKRYVRHYRQPKFAKLLAERGDVERSFRIDGRIYPIGDWCLKKIRTALDIPLTHAERCKANPNYEKYYPLEAAEYDPEGAEAWEIKLNAKKKITFYRGEAPKI